MTFHTAVVSASVSQCSVFAKKTNPKSLLLKGVEMTEYLSV